MSRAASFLVCMSAASALGLTALPAHAQATAESLEASDPSTPKSIPVDPSSPLCPPGRPAEPLFAPGALFLRFAVGPGYAWASGDPNTKLNGGSGGFDLTMGGFVASNLALHADFGWFDIFDPDFSVNGNVIDSTSVVFQASTFRAGASYYFMPVRTYLSLGVGFAAAAVTSYSYSDTSDNNVTLVGREYTKVGPTFAAEIGKEFAVSPEWGLGLAGHYELLSVPPNDDHAKATVELAQQLSLRFIATYGSR